MKNVVKILMRVNESEMIYNATFNDYENACGSWAIYTVFIFIRKQ